MINTYDFSLKKINVGNRKVHLYIYIFEEEEEEEENEQWTKTVSHFLRRTIPPIIIILCRYIIYYGTVVCYGNITDWYSPRQARDFIIIIFFFLIKYTFLL